MIDGGQGPERLDFVGFFRVIIRQWALVVTVMGVVVALTLIWSVVQAPRYAGSADVLVEASTADIAASGSTEVDPEEVATQAQVITSLPVARIVAAKLGRQRPPQLTKFVAAEIQGSSRVVRVTATAGDPLVAARMANLVARSYLLHRSVFAQNRYDQDVTRLSDQQSAAEERIDAIDTELADNPDNAVELSSERRALETRLGQLATQLADINAAAASPTAGGQVLQQAVPSTTPVSPKTGLNVALAALFGLLLGVGAALLRHRVDDTVSEESEVRRLLPQATELGSVPAGHDGPGRRGFATLAWPRSATSEAFQTLAVRTRFTLEAAAGGRHRDSGSVVVVTSGRAGEGKTSTAANLAVAATRMGLRVTLVDADLRSPTLGTRFGRGMRAGLAELLANDEAPARYLRDVEVDRLSLLGAGSLPSNPVELLASERMGSILQALAKDVDLVVVDSSSILAVADGLWLANVADLVVVVARSGVTRRAELRKVGDTLATVGVVSMATAFRSERPPSRMTTFMDGWADRVGARQRVAAPHRSQSPTTTSTPSPYAAMD